MGKPSDVVLQLSAVACPWKQFCFGFGLLSRCRPADSWWSPDPREQVKKKGNPKTKARHQRCKSQALVEICPTAERGALGRTGESSIETHSFHLSAGGR